MKYLTYDDILYANRWSQKIVQENIEPTYGIKDDNLLHSIPKSIQQSFDGVEIYPTVYDKAAYLWEALSKYHCFADGNKRTALLTLLFFLHINGYAFESSEPCLYKTCMKLASEETNTEDTKTYITSNTYTSYGRILKINEYLKVLAKDEILMGVIQKLSA